MPFILKIWASGIACVLWVSMAPSNLRPALGLQSHEFLNRVSSEFLNPLAHRVFASGRVLASSFIPLKIGPQRITQHGRRFQKGGTSVCPERWRSSSLPYRLGPTYLSTNWVEGLTRVNSGWTWMIPEPRAIQ